MYVNSIAKRVFDLVGFVVSIFVFGAVFAFIAIAIFLEDRKSIFFIQRRVGRNKSSIKVYKFRTMEAGVVTKVGRWLRKTGLDELPQYLNVFFGEMSIVGPRPLTEYDIQRLNWQNNQYRWQMKPGITGLAQIRSGISAENSILADREYLETGKLSLDIKIIVISFLMNILGKRRVQRYIPQFIF